MTLPFFAINIGINTYIVTKNICKSVGRQKFHLRASI